MIGNEFKKIARLFEIRMGFIARLLGDWGGILVERGGLGRFDPIHVKQFCPNKYLIFFLISYFTFSTRIRFLMGRVRGGDRYSYTCPA